MVAAAPGLPSDLPPTNPRFLSAAAGLAPWHHGRDGRMVAAVVGFASICRSADQGASDRASPTGEGPWSASPPRCQGAGAAERGGADTATGTARGFERRRTA